MNFPKTIHTAMMGAAFFGGLMLAGCSETPAEQAEDMNDKMEGVQEEINEAAAADTPREWEKERNDVLDKLRNMRDDINDELEHTNERLAKDDLKADKRAEEQAMQAELMREKTRVDELIVRVEGSDQGNWNTVRDDARTTGDEIEAWWKRFKDNIDKKTDADKDGDGK